MSKWTDEMLTNNSAKYYGMPEIEIPNSTVEQTPDTTDFNNLSNADKRKFIANEFSNIKSEEPVNSNNPYLRSIFDNLDIGSKSVLGGTSSFLGAQAKNIGLDGVANNLLQYGTDVNNEVNQLQSRHIPSQDYGGFWDAATNLNYYTDPNGFTGDVSNGVGSTLGMLPLAIPASGAAAALKIGGKLSKVASNLLGKAGMNKLAQKAASETAENIINTGLGFGLGGGGLEAVSDAGNIVDDLKAQGYSDSDIASITLKLAANELPYLAASDAITGAGLTGKIGKALGLDKGSIVKRVLQEAGVNVPLQMTSEYATEMKQQQLQNEYTNKPYGTFFNPLPDEKAAGRAGAFGGLAIGGLGAARGVFDNNSNAGNNTAREISNNNDDVLGNVSTIDVAPTGTEKIISNVEVPVEQAQPQQNLDQKFYNVTGEVSNTGITNLTEQKLNLLSRDFQNKFGVPLDVTSMKRNGDGTSWHDNGQAVDVVSDVLANNEEARNWLMEQGTKYGLKGLDEYSNPSANATGGHIHFSDHGESLGQTAATTEPTTKTIQTEIEVPTYTKEDLGKMAQKLDDALNTRTLTKEEKQAIINLALEKSNIPNNAEEINKIENLIDTKDYKSIAELFPAEASNIIFPQEVNNKIDQQTQQMTFDNSINSVIGRLPKEQISEIVNNIMGRLPQQQPVNPINNMLGRLPRWKEPAINNKILKYNTSNQQLTNNFNQEKINTNKGIPINNVENITNKNTVPNNQNGKISTVRTDDGTEFNVQYKLMDADSLITSHQPNNFAPNRNYPQELQPRKRERLAMKNQISDMVTNLRPADLAESRAINQGAPLINSNGIVENGNGRAIALTRMYKSNAKTKEKYLQFLKENAANYGLDSTIIDKMKNPILVRQRLDNVDMNKIITSTEGGAVLGAGEAAQVDAKKIKESTLYKYVDNENGDLLTVNNKDFVNNVLNDIASKNEMNQLIDEKGNASQEGIARVKNALFAKAYGDDGLLSRMAESTDNNIKNITNALVSAAPYFSKIKTKINSGALFNYDTSDIVNACKKLVNLREEGKPVSVYVKETTMFSDGISDNAKDILSFFDKNKQRPKKISNMIKRSGELIEGLGNPNEINMFGDQVKMPNIGEIYNKAIGDVNGEQQQNLFGQSGIQQSEQGINGTIQQARTNRENKALQREPVSVQNNEENNLNSNVTNQNSVEQTKSSEPNETYQEENKVAQNENKIVNKQSENSTFGNEQENEDNLLKSLGLERQEEKKPFNLVDDSDEALNNCLKELQQELNKMSANPMFNPDLMKAAFKVGAIYVQRGANNFSAWSKQMIDAVGNKIEPWLGCVWKSIQSYPKNVPFNEQQMSAAIKYVGSSYENGKTNENDIIKSFEKLVGEEKSKPFVPLIKSAYAGINEFFEGGKENVNDSTSNVVERPSTGDNKNSMGQNDEVKRSNGEDGRSLQQAREKESSTNDNNSVRYSGPTSSREISNSTIQAKESTDNTRSTRSAELSRSVADSYDGVPIEREGTTGITPPIKNRRDYEANKLNKKAGTLKSVQDDLPMLLPEQQDDVIFAEKRLIENNKNGVLFTNGTGTGKTFTGLGIVKRFVDQDKKNILIVTPSTQINKGWIASAKDFFGLKINELQSTEDQGKDVTITTYSNLQSNKELANRNWDLIIPDESHKLMENQNGDRTGALKQLHVLTMHEKGFNERFKLVNRTKNIRETEKDIKALQTKLNKQTDTNSREKISEKIKSLEKNITNTYYSMEDKRKQQIEEWENIQEEDKPKVVFLSATPFAYDKCIDYADGYLFNYSKADGSSYNSGNGKEKFFMENFGYRMRYNKLTKPETTVDNRVMEVMFHEKLEKDGALSGRKLEVDKDYDRGFIVVKEGIGHKFDEGFAWLRDNKNGNFIELLNVLQKQFNARACNYILESIKAKEAIPLIKEYLNAGKKVVLFHQSMKSKDIIHPFKLDTNNLNIIGSERDTVFSQYARFKKMRPDLIELNTKDLASPLNTLTNEFGNDLLLFNGEISKSEKDKNVKAFNDDNSGKNIILVQQDAGNAGISLHDVTGKHQRVLINLAVPSRPIYAIQIEGRIYRVGCKTNAIFRYLSTGTNMEKHLFANTVAERASTAENLALGSEARNLRDSFVNAYMETLDESWKSKLPNAEGEGTGGKEADKAVNNATSEFDRTKTLYYAQQKKNAKTKSQEGNDYYPTPEPLGYKMVEWANVKDGDSILEPSAGHGSIARFFSPNLKSVAIEPSNNLKPLLQMNTDGTNVINSKFEDYYVGNKFDAVVMNPPYGTKNKTAMEHVDKAFKHLRDGGRVIAIVPNGPIMDKRLAAWEEKEEHAYKVAEIILPSTTFNRAGTGVNTKIVIYDKYLDNEKAAQIQQHDFDLSDSKNQEDLFDRIENLTIPDRVVNVESDNKTYQWKDNVTKEILSKIENAQNELNEYLKEHGETININTPERKVLRQKIADELYGDGAKNKNKEIYIVMGLPASGKSSISEPLAKRTGSIIIDSDMAKEHLPEFNLGKLAGAVHSESDYITSGLVMAKAIVNEDNIVLPVVGKTYEGLANKINAFSPKGYKVNIVHVDLPIEKAIQRCINRFKETGRFVDPEYVSSIGYTTRENYDKIKNMEGVVSYEAFSNNVTRGERPTLLERGMAKRGLARPLYNGSVQGSGKNKEQTEINHSDDEQGGFSIPKGFVTDTHTDTRDGKLLYRVKLVDKTDDFSKIRAIAKENNGMYSRFAKGFLFEKESDRDNFISKASQITTNDVNYSVSPQTNKTPAEWQTEIEKAFPKCNVTQEEDGSFTVKTKSGNNIYIDVVNQILLPKEIADQERAKNGLAENEPIAVNGRSFVLDGNGIISLVSNGEKGTVLHEALHLAKSMVLSEKEIKALDKAIPNEEKQANAYRDWRNNRQKGGMFGKLWNKIYDFSKRVQAMFGNENMHHVFSKIESGEVWNRENKTNNSNEQFSIDSSTSFITNALNNAMIKAGLKAEKNVEIVTEDKSQNIRFLRNVFNSMNKLAERYPKFKPFFRAANIAREKQENLRNHLMHKVDKIEKILGNTGLGKRNDALYKQNKLDLDFLLKKGDAQHKEFTNKELFDQGYSESVIKAYRIWRSIAHETYNLINDTKQQIETFTSTLSEEKYNNLVSNNFAHIISDKKLESGEHLVTWKQPKIFQTKKLLNSEELEILKADKNVQIISTKLPTKTAPKGTNLLHGDNFYEVEYRTQEPPVKKVKGYIPHFFHDIFIMQKTEKNGIEELHTLKSAKTMDEAIKIANEYATKNPNEKIVIMQKMFQFPDETMQAAVIGDKEYDSIMQRLSKDLCITINDAKELMNDKLMKKNRRRFLGNVITRENAKGYEQDMDWAIRHYINQVSRYVAMDECKRNTINRFEQIFGKWDSDNLSEQAIFIKDFINDINGVPTKAEEILNSLIKSTPGLNMFFGKVFPDRPALQYASWLTSIAASLKLNILNVASTMMQLTQFMNIAGSLNSYQGTAKAIKSALNPTIKQKMFLREAGLEAELNMSVSGGFSNAEKAHKFLGCTTWTFNKADRLLRATALLGAYEKAINEGKSKDEAMEYAKKINRMTNFDYSVADAPNLFRRSGPIGQLALQFQKYPIKQMEFMWDMFTQGQKVDTSSINAVGKDFIKILKTNDKAQMARFFVPYFMLSGMIGFPLVSVLGSLIGCLFRWDDWEEKVKKAAFEWAGNDKEKLALVKAAIYGAAAIPENGADIGYRVGIGDFGDFNMPKTKMEMFIKLLLGVTGSSLYQAQYQYSQGNIPEAIKAMSPGLGNIAIAAAGEIKTTRGRTKYSFQEDTYGKILKALGFMPIGEKIESDTNRIIKVEESNRREEEKQAIDDYINDPSSDNLAKIKEMGITPKRIKMEKAKKNQTVLERLSKKEKKTYSDIL